MKLAYSAPSPDETQRRRLFDHLQSTGYAGVQLKPADYKPFLDSPQRLFETYPQLQGMISACIDYGHLDRAEIRKVIAFAKAVGSGLIVYCHSAKRDGLTRAEQEAIAATCDEIGRESSQSGVRWTLHHHHNQPCMRREDFDVFFGRPRQFGLTVDTAHLVKSGITDIAEVIRSFRHAVWNFHMKDYANGEWKVLGEGQIDFAPVFAAVKDIGYTGWVSADEESGGDVVDGMRKCAAVLKQLL